MIVAIISEWFSENMGYAENHLPKALNKLGCEVHVITSDLQIYATDKEFYNKTYAPYLGPPVVETGVKQLKGFKLHRLPHYGTEYGIGLEGLFEKLQEIKPDVVYLFEINTEHTLQVIKYRPVLKYKIFTESRLHRSVYQPPIGFKARVKHYFSQELKWKKAGESFERIYPIAPDVLTIIQKYFGQQKRKCVLSSLAVDTDNFTPIDSEEQKLRRSEIRKELGFEEQDVVCIYTGRFTDSKGTILLAQAIDHLQKQGTLK